MDYVYVGQGRFHQGLPAADVTGAFVATLTAEQRALFEVAVKQGLYAPKTEANDDTLGKVMMAGDLRKAE